MADINSGQDVDILAGDNVIGRVKITDGTDVADVIDSGTYAGVGAYILDGSGNPITSFGGGTQYTEADTDASITGTAMMMEGAANALVPAQGTAADGLLVNLGANNDVTVTGTVTVGSHAVTNAGTFVVQENGAALTALQLIDNIVGVEDAGETAGGGLAMAGSVRRDTAAASSGTTGDNSTINTSAEGALWGTLTPTTTSGLSISRDIDLDNSTLTVVKASAGNLYGYYIANTITSNIFVKFYNATSGTLGTGTPVLTFMVPAGSAANVGFQYPISFATGICVGATTDVADAGTTDPGANACIANIFYK